MADPNIEKLFKKYYVYCIQRLKHQTSSQSDAKELYIKAFTKYWLKYSKGELQNIEKPEHYLLKTARNIWLDQKRKKNIEYAIDSDELEAYQNKKIYPSNEEQFNELIKKETIELSKKEQQKRKICLKEAFKQLTPKCQKLLTAIFTYNKTNTQILQEFGYTSINVVKSTKYRCKESLKKLFQKEYNKKGR